MAIRISTVKACEILRFLPTRTVGAELVRRRNEETGELMYTVRYYRQDGQSEFETPDFVRAKSQYEFWRDLVHSAH